jgi:hypothetical protein
MGIQAASRIDFRTEEWQANVLKVFDVDIHEETNMYELMKANTTIDCDVLFDSSMRDPPEEQRKQAARMIMWLAFGDKIPLKDERNEMAWFGDTFMHYADVVDWKQADSYGDAAPYGLRFASLCACETNKRQCV